MSALRAFLDDLVRPSPAGESAASAAVALVGNADEVLQLEVAGEAHAASRFDLASLTKTFTATLALVLDRRQALPLGRPLGEIFPHAAPPLAAVSLADLLRHRAGFISWYPLYHRCTDRQEVVDLLLGGELLRRHRGQVPPGDEAVYSDLGPLLWGLAAEEALGRALPELLAEYVLEPLELASVGWRPSVGVGEFAASRIDTAKEVELAAALDLVLPVLPAPAPGEVQDGNARFLASLGPPVAAAHAGLFGVAEDLWRFGREWLRPGRVLDPAAVASALDASGPLALGWFRSQAGFPDVPGARSFGHNGFTGTSLWLDASRQRIYLLLAHRRSPLENFDPWRRRFHEAVL